MMTTVINAAAPCPYPPGSVGKVAWLEARARLRLPLFHHGDAGDLDLPEMTRGLFARSPVATQPAELRGKLAQPGGREAIEAVADGEVSVRHAARRVGVDPRTLRDAAERLRAARRRLQTA